MAKKNHLSKHVASLHQKNKIISHNLNHMTMERKELERAYVELQQSARDREAQLLDLVQNMDLERVDLVKTLEKERKARETTAEDVRRLQQDLTQATHLVETREQQHQEDVDELSRRIDASSLRVRQLETSLDKAQAQNRDLSTKHQSVNGQLMQAQLDLVHAKKESAGEMEELKSQLEKWQNQTVDFSRTMEQELHDRRKYETKLKKVSEEFSQHRIASEKKLAERDREVDRWREECDAREEDIKILKESIENLESLVDGFKREKTSGKLVDDLRRDLAKAHDKIASQSKQLVHLQSRLISEEPEDEVVKHLQASQDRVNELELQVQELDGVIANHEQMADHMQESFASKQRELLEKEQEWQTKLLHVNQQLQSLAEERDANLVAWQAEKDSLLLEVEKAEKERDELARCLDSMQQGVLSEKQDLLADIGKKNEEIFRLQEELLSLEYKIVQQKQEMQNASLLDADLRAAETRIHGLVQDMQQLQAEKQELEHEKREWQLERETLLLEKEAILLEKQNLQVNEWEDTKQELLSQIDDLKSTLQECEEQRDTAMEQVEEFSAKCKQLEMDKAEYADANAEFEEANKEFEMELEETRAELDALTEDYNYVQQDWLEARYTFRNFSALKSVVEQCQEVIAIQDGIIADADEQVKSLLEELTCSEEARLLQAHELQDAQSQADLWREEAFCMTEERQDVLDTAYDLYGVAMEAMEEDYAAKEQALVEQAEAALDQLVDERDSLLYQVELAKQDVQEMHRYVDGREEETADMMIEKQRRISHLESALASQDGTASEALNRQQETIQTLEQQKRATSSELRQEKEMNLWLTNQLDQTKVTVAELETRLEILEQLKETCNRQQADLEKWKDRESDMEQRLEMVASTQELASQLEEENSNLRMDVSRYAPAFQSGWLTNKPG